MPAGLARRSLLGWTAALVTLPAGATREAEVTATPPIDGIEEWQDFLRLYVTEEGRVVDTANHGTSHSEGQGWGLLLAEAFDDERSFNRMLGWARRELRRPSDNLMAWAWRPDRAVPVEDHNNATDGDIFVAWALQRAARRWQRPELLELGIRVAQDLHSACVRELRGRMVLLPAAFGFEHRDHVVLNPSYYVIPAFGALAQLMPDGRWLALRQDGLALLREARFGRWGLPADWISLSRHEASPPSLPSGWPPRFSYDAVRVPLYLAWAGLEAEPAAQAAARFWSSSPVTPAWTDLVQNNTAPYPADSGFLAVAKLVHDPAAGPEFLPRVRQAPHYYAAALTLLARLAAFERPYAQADASRQRRL
ncbi:glycosyl hydrolase family 8 [Teichococcus oryzae]|uniref:cellulase n=1 Tax=Teichococcus oryzae TaxID=1608942 RepID=A0A5B2TLL9_9PROT|nr:glycosyl hydrolase family 8 [Pseudoroseomonas oryzae]KAA2215013.1 glycosyl hydrolase family 5 [Pseudoroseomonas oryzae]